MNLPNKLTLLRAAMIPFFVVILLAEPFGEISNYVALAIFCVASATDWLDGYLARRDHLVTNFGKFMDPLADKLLVSAAMLCLIGRSMLPEWVVVIIISREFIISGFRLVASDNGVVIAASYWGKLKTVSQMLMIILLLLNLDHPVFHTLEIILIVLATALTIISLVDYIIKNKNVLSEGGN